MGKDKNKEQDGEPVASAESITSPPQCPPYQQGPQLGERSMDTALAKTIAKAVARETAKAHAHYQALLNERSATVIPTSLKVTSGANGFKVMDPFDWKRTKLSTRDGNCGQRRLDLPLMLGKVTQKRLRFHTFTIGLMEKEGDTLNHGKTTKPSSANLSMID